MASYSGSRRGERLRSLICCRFWMPRGRRSFGSFYADAPSIPFGRLRDLEVRCAHSKGRVEATRASNTARGVASIRAEFVPKPGEIVASEHWCSSGFANTDLDLQLKKHGIHQLIVIGLIAHT